MTHTLAQLQENFTRHLRDPSTPLPAGVSERAMGIYSELVFHNIEGFLAAVFPVLSSVLRDDLWPALVRQFIIHHRCQTPYFREISQEFLQFLMANPSLLTDYPGYTLELAHYEWVELALDTSTETMPPLALYSDVLDGLPVVSPLAWGLSYQYPVFLIGQDNPYPNQQPCHLVVYRTRDLDVKFLAANALTLRLLQLLPTASSGRAACLAIAHEINHPDQETLLQEGKLLLEQLLALEIISSVNAVDNAV